MGPDEVLRGLCGVSVVAAVAVLSATAFTPTSQAAFPGGDGTLAFSLNYDFYCGEGEDDYPCAIGRNEGINVIPPSGGSRSFLVRYGFQAAWSADGSRLAYTIPDSRSLGPPPGIWVARADGTKRKRLLRSGRDPVWSPGGGKLALIRGNGNVFTTKVATFNLATGQTRALARGRDPSWAADGRIAYSSPERRTVDLRIAILSPRTGRKKLITAGESDISPDWSPTGGHVVFERRFDSIWIVRADGHGARRLTSGADPAWSPSGRWIAFCRGEGLYVVRPDGRGERRVLATGSFRPEAYVDVTPTGPAWQPIG